MRTIVIKDRIVIPLGRIGENEATTIKFNIASFFPGLSGALYELVHKRPGDASAYLVRDKDDGRVRDGFVTWVVKDSDLGETSGNGTAQLTAYKDGVRIKTVTFTTQIADGMGVGPKPKKPEQPWVDQVFEECQSVKDLASETSVYAESASASAAEAAEYAASLPGTVSAIVTTSLAEAKASGEFDGADGYSPTVTVQPITGGHQVTITDVNGDHTFVVADGEDGSGGGATEIFWATPWRTTTAELDTAYQNGKVLMIRMDMYVFSLQYRAEDGSKYSFTSTFSFLNRDRRSATTYTATLECNSSDDDWDMFLIGHADTSVFWAEYGETTAAEMIEILEEGDRAVMCAVERTDATDVYYATAYDDDPNNPVVTMVSTDGPALYIINVIDSGGEPTWSKEDYYYPNSTSATPQMDGIGAAGTDNGRYARADHVHPSDTSRAPAAAGIPAGGTKYYALVKASSADYDAEWAQISKWVNVSYNKTTGVAVASITPLELIGQKYDFSIYASYDNGEHDFNIPMVYAEFFVPGGSGVTYYQFRFEGLAQDMQGNPLVVVYDFPMQDGSATSLVGTGTVYKLALAT
ncbi:MAG: hypothetical protein J6Y20_08970 [Lachnospiraceae bacterium]|nr:hypothetical protein [Lachnospiraceae bacterium]